MQILFGVDETIIKINSKSISIDYIQQFINTHFINRKIDNNHILIPEAYNHCSHRTFLLKWLYSLYAKNYNHFPELKETLLLRHKKAIRITTAKKTIYSISYKIIDNENIHLQVKPHNHLITNKIATFLQTKITIMPTYLKISFNSQDSKNLLKKFINTNNIINIPHQHIFNKIDMQRFLSFEKKIQKKILTPMQTAYIVLGINQNDDLKTIKKKYKSLAKLFHPDKFHNENKNILDKSTKEFQKISEAYNIIISN